MRFWRGRTALMFVAMTGILVALGSLIGYIFNYMWVGFYIMMALSLVICICSYFFSKKMALSANKVRIVTEAEEPRLYRTVQKLAMKAKTPVGLAVIGVALIAVIVWPAEGKKKKEQEPQEEQK